MRVRIRMAVVWAALMVLLPLPTLRSAEIVRLSEENWPEYAPLGKEVDAIYGDYVLRNDRIVAVIANPIEGRNANMKAKRVGGFLIDLTDRNQPSDQLVVLSGPLSQYPMQWAHIQNEKGRKVTLLCSTLEAKDTPLIQIRYSLEDGRGWLHVETVLSNTTSKSLSVELTDAVRAERTFTSGKEDDGSLAWIYDKWFGQAYGFVPDGKAKTVSLKFGNKVSRFEYTMGGQNEVTLAPGEKVTLKRWVLCAANALQIRSIANRLKNVDQHPVTLTVTDPKGVVVGADVDVKVGDTLYANGRVDQNGVIEFSLPPGPYTLTAASLGRGSVSVPIQVGAALQTKIVLPEAGYVKARITDSNGGPIPCKVQFIGRDGTKDPYFFPDTGEHRVH
ncbi:MAG: hypothetical protein IID32_05715, partial [Planctomycetes bacterium]|nr:hypothetical protein [Planctomycetota bacterium]